MGASLNICALLVGLAVLSGRAISRSSVPLRKGWFHRLDGVGILALFLFIVSPELIIGPGPDGVFGTSDDDRFQQQLIRPRTRCVITSTHTRASQRRSLTNLWMNASGATGDPVLAARTRRSSAADRPLERPTFFQAPVAIHSPPIAS